MNRYTKILALAVGILVIIGLVFVYNKVSKNPKNADSSPTPSDQYAIAPEISNVEVVAGEVVSTTDTSITILTDSGETQTYSLDTEFTVFRPDTNPYPVPKIKMFDKEVPILPTLPESNLKVADLRQGDPVALNIVTKDGKEVVNIVLAAELVYYGEEK